MKRTHNCGELNKSNINKEVTLNGWVHTRRDHGGLIFIDLRDRYGYTQLVFSPQLSPEIHKIAESLRDEFVIAVRGKVYPRPAGTENLKLPTGEIEVMVDQLELVNKSKALPFPIDSETEVNEDIRLRYRYLDLKRPKMQETLIIRHKACAAAREFLTKEGFIEIETPMLTKSTPEGARDYLVPSRVYNGKFYALPQSPQLFKQILMVAGFEKYFQIVKCFRDEDLRADRQPEFTQIDMEMSFVDEEDILKVTEGLMFHVFSKAINCNLNLPFRKMNHSEAMSKYGTDKPDLRWNDMLLVDVTDKVKNAEFKVFKDVVSKGGMVKGINVSGCSKFSRKDIDELTSFAIEQGAKGLAWIKIAENKWEGPISKFFNDEVQASIGKMMDIKSGDLLLFVADKKDIVNTTLSSLRTKLIERLELKPKEKFSFVWIVDFPLFAYNNEENRFDSEHHPFTAPKREDMELLEKEPQNVRAASYDLVLNGYEVGSGSVRIHNPELQSRIFELLKLDKKEIQERFGFFLEALQFGAPPHAGIAPGLDRIIMIMTGNESIRDVIAFPKTQRAICPMTGSPTEVNPKQLKELGLKLG